MRLLLLAISLFPLAAQPVTFNKQIAPILFRNCAPCHRPGEAAPFPLLTYADAQKHASQIVAVTHRGYMPPWPPEPGYGDLAGARRLTPSQLHLIAGWLAGGLKEGAPDDLPAPPHFTEGWQLGAPDLVIEMPRPYQLAAGGKDVFRNFIVPVNLAETRYIRAIELRLGNKKIVHHANVLIDRTQSLRRRDGSDGQPGFPGMDVTTESGTGFDPDSHFLFWKPGSIPQPEPDDMGWRLDPATDLILNLHLQPSGKPELLQPRIGLYFARHPATRFPMLLQLENDGALNIPPESRDFTVQDRLTLPVDVDVLAIYPHAHYLGKQVEAWATLPDGTRRWLIKINDWDINWQAVYTYRHPVALPKGSTVAMRITYDNSSANPRNPTHPPKRVRSGDRGEDEMGHVWLQVLPRNVAAAEDPRLALQEALMRRRLEKYPDDFVAHYSLGALLDSRGQHHEAVDYFQTALRLQPLNPTARNGFAAALLADDRPDDALRELRETLRIEPQYVNARYNLAQALTAKGDMNGAAIEYAAYLEHKPEDAGAQLHLAGILLEQRRFDEALPHLREAARLKPDADTLANLGALLAMRGDLPGAIAAFEQALRIDPNHRAASSNLERARANAR